MSERQKRGFACGDNASKAGRKAHEMGVAHRWSREEAAEWGRRNVQEQTRDDRGRLQAKPSAPVTMSV